MPDVIHSPRADPLLPTNEASVTKQMPDRDPGSPWLTVRGAALRALCSEATVLREARKKRLRGFKIGGRRCWRFLKDDVDRWLMQRVEPVESVPHPHDTQAR